MAKTLTIARGNETGEIDEKDLPKAISAGWSVVSDEDADHRDQLREADTLPQQALGLVESGAAGLTFGLSRPILKETLGDEYAEGAAARREVNPYLNQGAEMVGAVAPALLSGGTGVAGSLARATPAGKVAQVANTAARGRGLVAQGAVAAAEGAVQGATYEVSEAMLGEREISGERIFAAAGVSGLLGMGVPAVGRVAAAGGRRAAGGLSDFAAGAAGKLEGSAPRVAQKLEDFAIGTSAMASGIPKELLREGAQALRTPEGRRVWQLQDYALKAEREAAGGAIGETIIPLRDALARVRELSGDERISNAWRLMEGAENPVAISRTRAFLDGFEARVMRKIEDERAFAARARADGFAPPTTRSYTDAQEVGRAIERAKDDLITNIKNPSGADAFRVVDKLRREIGLISKPYRGGFGNTLSNEELASKKFLDELYAGARGHTTDESVFGAAASAHAAELGVLKKFMDSLDVSSKNAYGKLLDPKLGDPDIGTMMNLARDWKGSRWASGNAARQAVSSQRANAFMDTIDRAKEVIELMKRTRDLDPADLATIRQFEAADKAMRARIAQYAEKAHTLEVVKEIRQVGESGFSPSNIAGQIGGPAAAAVGFSMGGVPGAIAGGLYAAVARPYTTGRKIAALANLVDGMKRRESNLGTGIMGLVDGVTKAAGAAPGAVRRAVTNIVAQPSPKQRQADLLKIRDRVNDVIANPELLSDLLRDDDAWREAPGVSAAQTTTAARAVAFLKAVEPVTYKPAFSNVEIVDPIALDRYERHVHAVANPIASMELILSGVFAKEHKEALQAVYPRMFDGLRQLVLTLLGRAQQQRRNVPHKARVMLGLMLGLPLDDSLRPEFRQQQQATQQPGASQPIQPPAPQVRAGGELNRPAQTPMDRIEAGGERT